ncbi:MAG TPA: hypothetical protein VFA45_18850 [Actinomycetes bacterium]|nr:hypothetical protein [Actinomycetes bacterium]
MPHERPSPRGISAERQRQLADACAKASETIEAARAASDRANLVLRAADQVLARVARALERRAGN